MQLSLPKDAIRLLQSRSRSAAKCFRFKTERWRVTIPYDIVRTFPDMGVDMFVSPKEQCLYLSFGKKDDTQFRVNQKNGYTNCKKLYEWAANAEVPIHDDYVYDDYIVDKKNKLVRLNLKRK